MILLRGQRTDASDNPAVARHGQTGSQRQHFENFVRYWNCIGNDGELPDRNTPLDQLRLDGLGDADDLRDRAVLVAGEPGSFRREHHAPGRDDRPAVKPRQADRKAVRPPRVAVDQVAITRCGQDRQRSAQRIVRQCRRHQACAAGVGLERRARPTRNAVGKALPLKLEHEQEGLPFTAAPALLGVEVQDFDVNPQLDWPCLRWRSYSFPYFRKV